MVVPIIFPVILQTVINFRKLSIGGQEERSVPKCTILLLKPRQAPTTEE